MISMFLCVFLITNKTLIKFAPLIININYI
nr:MAG TPA: hypothetical protein [Caudoviricetes sp.]